jgi:hypothetical protein
MSDRSPEPADSCLVARLGALARGIAGAAVGPAAVLSHRSRELVVRYGAVVVKAHAPQTDRAALDARLAALATPALREVLLAPLGRTTLDGQPVTVWPAGEPLRPDQLDEAPWEAAGELLARLHRTPAPAGLPPAGGPDRVRRAMLRLADSPMAGGRRAAAVRAAYGTLPPLVPGDGLAHGDWHLGQLVRMDAGPGPGAGVGGRASGASASQHDPGWRMVDIDDLGICDPVWDLARPAAWFAAGVMPPPAWYRLVAAYRAAGGPAVPPDGDPWPALDLPARALAVQTAAIALVNSDLDVAEAFVTCCRRIARLEATYGVRALSKLLRE